MNRPNIRLTSPETSPKPRFRRAKRLSENVKGTAIAEVISIIPATVPMPKTRRYKIAQDGTRMVVSTNKATAADPARPCTMPTANGRMT